MNETETETLIQSTPPTGPRITPRDIDEAIDPLVKILYHRFAGTNVTVCCLTLRNGFNVIGYSSTISPAYYDAGVDERIAYENARSKIWELLWFSAMEEASRSERTVPATLTEQKLDACNLIVEVD